MELTQQRLKQVLSYDAATGEFIRIAASARAQRFIGAVAGRVHKKRGYREISVDGKLYLAHRLAWLYMTGRWPTGEIDHRNHSRDDNRWTNLRDVSTSINQLNRSDVSGATFYRSGNYERWRARVTVDGRERSLGYFHSKDEASAVAAAERANFQ